VDVRVQRRQTRDSDVVGQQVKFRDVPPGFSFRFELEDVSHATESSSEGTYHGDDEHLGRNGGALVRSAGSSA
jgi:hypothetical protein